MAISAIHGLKVSMYTAFGKAGAICQAPNALFAVFTNRVENDNALGPQSHGVGPCSEGWLKLEKSTLQSTRWTPACPALRRCPGRSTSVRRAAHHGELPRGLLFCGGCGGGTVVPQTCDCGRHLWPTGGHRVLCAATLSHDRQGVSALGPLETSQ